MFDNSKYELFILNLIKDTPEFMIINQYNEDYIVFDRFVMSLSDKAMPWLVKVYLEEKYNILKNDNFTFDIRNKYNSLSLRLINSNGNLFFNKDALCALLIELEQHGQVKYNEENSSFSLL